jgi:hypothetical protein
MYLNYNADQIHKLFNESKKCIFAYICGWREYYYLQPIEFKHGIPRVVKSFAMESTEN